MQTPNEREEDLFREALQRVKGRERDAFLLQACAGDPALRGRLEELLRAHDTPDSFLEPPAGDFCEESALPSTQQSTVHSAPVTEKPGDQIGRYKLREKLGEGGGGVVYVADQAEPMRRRVALKVIKLGMDTRNVVARFEAERQALAMMDHPNIAKVLDAGATETGRPFFVMELVRGVRITDYCDQHSLSTDERLKLFVQVCHAIQHAHQKGVIHRDIKPSNILVMLADDVPIPKVIDFGIAKAISERLTDKTVYTELHQFIGTPAYTSPEQAGMSGLDVDTRSDIYALGVLLYELLTGRTPFEVKELAQAGWDEILRRIREVEAPKPSTRLSRLEPKEQTSTAQRRATEPPKLIRSLRGDLDWIVMKCLEKNRTQRYETANELARDIERHLTQQPTLARPPSTVYRVQKFVGRHKVMVGAVGAVSVALVLGIIVSTWQAVRARRAETRAEAEASLARQAEKTAREETQVARVERQRAREAAEAARQNLYAADMNLACQAQQENNLGLMLELLNKHHPAPRERDLRGWEWRYLWGLCQSDALYTFGRHSDGSAGVYGVAASPDGKLLATISGGGSGEVNIWDVESHRLIETPEAREAVGSVSFSPDGKMLAFGTYNQGVRLWDLQKHLAVNQFPGATPRGFGTPALGFSSKGRQLAIGATGGSVVLWDIATHAAGLTLQGHSNDICCLVLSRDGQTLATGSSDQTIRIWDLARRYQVAVLTNHTEGVQCLALSPDSKTLASGSFDDTVRIWDLIEHRPVAVLTHHAFWVSGLAFSPDGKTLASASADCSIKFWDTGNWREVGTLRGSPDEVWGIAFSKDGKTLFSGMKGGKILAWDGQPHAPRAHVLKRPDDARDYGLSACDGIPYCQHSNHTFNLWDPRTLRKLPAHPVPDFGFSNNIVGVALWPGGERAAFCTRQGPVYLWDVEQEREITHFAGWPGQSFVEFSPDGKLLAAVAAGEGLKVWDVAMRQEVANLSKSPATPQLSPTFATNDEAVAIGNVDGTVEVWDLLRKERVASWKVCSSTVSGVAFMPDGKRLVTVSDDCTAALWELEAPPQAPRKVRSFGRAKNAYYSVAVSPDGQRIAAGTAGRRAHIKVWSVTTGQEVATLKGVDDWVDFSTPFSAVLGLAFLPPDGNTLISGTCNEARLWRAPSWEEIAAAEARDKNEGRAP